MSQPKNYDDAIDQCATAIARAVPWAVVLVAGLLALALGREAGRALVTTATIAIGIRVADALCAYWDAIQLRRKAQP